MFSCNKKNINISDAYTSLIQKTKLDVFKYIDSLHIDKNTILYSSDSLNISYKNFTPDTADVNTSYLESISSAVYKMPKTILCKNSTIMKKSKYNIYFSNMYLNDKNFLVVLSNSAKELVIIVWLMANNMC